MNRKVAIIEEINCVGCNKCMKICPVDSIVGSFNYIHTVMLDTCIGCGLCLNVCPTECITLKDRLFVSYIIKKITNKNFSLYIKDIEKDELLLNAKTLYKKKIFRLRQENMKNLCFYKNKKNLIDNIRKEIKDIISVKKFNKKEKKYENRRRK